MRAKRSKKYRKLMHQYEMAFGFREPYQVLVDSNFLRAVHSFKMDLIPALERTLQGTPKPLLTKCSLAAIMANQPINPKTNNPYRPMHLPPPTILPLRHCSHNEDSTPIDEVECLLSLLSPSADAKRNKEHYILATADPPAPPKSTSGGDARKRKRGDDEGFAALRRAQKLRVSARSIPGVPIVYVKRSVMILEPMSTPSENLRDGVERSKFRAGLNDEATLGKRKRGEEGEEKKKRASKKAKGPNPLSVKKSKKKGAEAAGGAKQEKRNEEAHRTADETPDKAQEDGESSVPKPKRRRRHHKGSKGEGNDGPDGAPSNEGQAATADMSD
ncbi:rRNA-binding ribosome biosynthesis protein UTP23 [Aspergillus clavatus NRRL 1]|uniref:rRNA processing protein, putative n=1 Tax=Aspergillus clavatus (strain ATCC 1007 / CBS 513.65 / DSM 816 / NCTC 3887 / NRRL 1 / QM 1276 / 107) TaxID=344612 RepID=A1CS24_ASPCL|nr:rRNA processing protein, putative [Aspergillus clavatus NRRL 1]EAW08445.1 rRNA processing protein, putative [Aspergillus clavatus NRRL 1]